MRLANRGRVVRGRPVGGAALRGFTLIELLVVLTLTMLSVGFGGTAFIRYFDRTSAQRAAQVFARDLTLARSSALRSRETVVIRFFEESRWYQMESLGSGTEIVRRRFGASADIDLNSIDLELAGDSIAFSSRGIAQLSGGISAVGGAVFVKGPHSFTVSFNAMGASKVEES